LNQTEPKSKDINKILCTSAISGLNGFGRKSFGAATSPLADRHGETNAILLERKLKET
jgi:hypothetical protein